MRLAHVDPFSGASGDMLLGALLDAGVAVGDLQAVLDGLHLPDWTLQAQPVVRGGISAVAVKVAAADEQPNRHWADVRRLLTKADLPEEVRSRALGAFTRLARVEARIHGTDVEDIVFHEVGAIDSIIDVVGVCAGLHLLGVQRLTSGPVAQGSGTVTTVHGDLPVPAPAVLELLAGVPVHGTDDAAELCTPTAAALLAELVDGWQPLPAMAVDAVGYGAGSRQLSRPNVLRLTLGRSVEDRPDVEQLVLVEATVDDMVGELVPVVLDALRSVGAKDAWARQVLMKKGRPGLELVCLADEAHLHGVRGVLFRQSTTLGLREQRVDRLALQRELATVEVAGQAVRVKLAHLDGSVVNVAPELDDCATVATATGLPVKEVMERARAAWQREADG